MEQIISKDGTDIGFNKSGSGPPPVFVHGTTADHKGWVRVASSFENHFTVYIMDRRGRGASGDSSDYSFMHEVEDVVALVDSTGERAFVLGHSFGGLLCLEACLLTDNIRSLILYEPAVPGVSYPIPARVPERMQALIDNDELEAALELFYRVVARIPEHELEAYRRMPLWEDRIQIAGTIPRELTIELNFRFDPHRYTGLHIPALLLLGGDSPVLTAKGVEAVDAALPESRVMVMPGVQHIAHLTAPEVLVRHMQEFLGV